MVASLGSFHRRGGTDVPVVDGGTGASAAAQALANLSGLDIAGHAAINHAAILGVPGALQSAFFQYAAATFVSTGALGFTPIAAIVISSNGLYFGVGIFRGTGAANQSAGVFNIGLSSGVVTNRVDGNALWTCTQFLASNVSISGASTTGALLVIGE